MKIKANILFIPKGRWPFVFLYGLGRGAAVLLTELPAEGSIPSRSTTY
jgi:hypothetical protein